MCSPKRPSFKAARGCETGRSEPKLATLIAVADYYQVSIDYLVGRTDVPDFHTSKG